MIGVEIFQSSAVVVTALSLIATTIVAVYTLDCWRQRHMKYFAFLAIAVFINVLGYYLEVTATHLQAAIVACKVSYVSAPLTGILLYFFSRVYSGRRKHRLSASIALLFPAPVFTVAVFLYPWLPIFYQDLTFSSEGLANHLIVTPGPLYYPCFIYGCVFVVLASANLITSFVRQKHYDGAVIFIIAIAVPLAAQLYIVIFGLIDGWNPQLTSLALSLVLLAIYLVRYKQAEWLSVGRELVVEDMNDAFILLDSKGMIIDNNSSAKSYFPELEQDNQRHILKDIWDFTPEDYTARAVHQVAMQKNGETKNLKVTTTPLLANGKSTGTLIVISDVTTTFQMIQELTTRSRIDELTGLLNRATFFREASRSFDLLLRTRTNSGCALMIDIDFFKVINDTYGHATGDQVLIYMGQLIESRFRHTDIHGRYGGEELSVWMPATTGEGALKVAEELRRAVAAKEFTHDGNQFNVTISIGVACLQTAAPVDFEDLMKKADLALYDAKNTGRNRICMYQGE